ncbi:pantoate--beta-alanine ligase [bacterium]|nr:pantoate--beta-alanine ligase [bacterium]
MKIITTVPDMQRESAALRGQGRTIGFVPTMGYLHAGHISLVDRARQEADAVVLSIYVNPTQFGPGEDFQQYPRDFSRDEAMAADAGVDFIFYPSDTEMYPEGHCTVVSVHEITDNLCGASRPGHFDGVTTICTKLFHAVNPHFAVFGQKDYQQCAVIRRMVQDLNMDLEIVTAPIVREPDGLAMSSRNVYLSGAERKDALLLYSALGLAKRRIAEGETGTAILIREMTDLIGSGSHTRIDYVKIVHPDTLRDLEAIDDTAVGMLAVFAGRTRLIDNMLFSK